MSETTEQNLFDALALWLCENYEDEDGIGCEPEAGPPCIGHVMEASDQLGAFLTARHDADLAAAKAAGAAEVIARGLDLANKWYPGEPGPRRMTSWAQLQAEKCARELRAALTTGGEERE